MVKQNTAIANMQLCCIIWLRYLQYKASLLESLGQAIEISRRRKEGIDLVVKHVPELPAVDGPRSHVKQVVEKRPFAAFPLSFVVATYDHVRLTPQDLGRLASDPF